MTKSNETAIKSSVTCIESDIEKNEIQNEENKEKEVEPTKTEEKVEKDEKKSSGDDESKDILKFTMLFNKYNSFLDVKRSPRNGEEKRDKFAMFFNKEVTVRSKPETISNAAAILQAKKTINQNGFSSVETKPKCCPYKLEPQISEPEMIFPSALDIIESKTQWKSLKKFLNKRNLKTESDSLMQLTDLRIHNSLTTLCNNGKGKGLASKIPSLTAIDGSSTDEKTKFCYWEHWDDLMLMSSDVDKRLNLQISRSSNDNNRRSTLKLKKEDAASVSDSKLLNADSECKKYLKKCDKKSRGDSSKKEKDGGNRKQVQWKTEVDVIYFSTHEAANGDRTGEVIGRVMEPLREEWEQQRKGFYAKLVPSHMENHMKDRFISLLKM